MSESGQGEPNLKEDDENVVTERLGRFRGEHLRILNKCSWGICASLSLTCIIGMAIIVLKLVFFKKTVLTTVTVLPADDETVSVDSTVDFTQDTGLRENVPNLFAALEHNLWNSETSEEKKKQMLYSDTKSAGDDSVPVLSGEYTTDKPLEIMMDRSVVIAEVYDPDRSTTINPITFDIPGEIFLLNDNDIIGYEVPIIRERRGSTNPWLRNNRNPTTHAPFKERERIDLEDTNLEKNKPALEVHGAMIPAAAQVERRRAEDFNWWTSGLLRVGQRVRRPVRRRASHSASRGSTEEILRGV